MLGEKYDEQDEAPDVQVNVDNTTPAPPAPAPDPDANDGEDGE